MDMYFTPVRDISSRKGTLSPLMSMEIPFFWKASLLTVNLHSDHSHKKSKNSNPCFKRFLKNNKIRRFN
jgi:hypothetical protein